MKDQLLSKIQDHTAVVAVVGLGYVGLPLAVAFAEKGFPVVGIDVDGRKVAALNRGESYVQDIPSARLAGVRLRGQGQGSGVGTFIRSPVQVSTLSPGHLVATTDFGILAQCDAAIICVPTPLNKTRDPDVRYVIAAGESVAKYVHPGMLVVLESTTYPGTTEELLLPMLTRRGYGDRESRQTSSRPNPAPGRSVKISSWPFRRSGLIRATSSTWWRTRRRWWAG